MTNIAAHAEAVAKAYWGEPAVRRGHILRWGTHGSKELDLRKGTWFDFENNEGGGVVDLVRKNEGATILGSIPDILEKKFGIQKQAQVSLQPARFMSACYDYIDEHGEVQYQVRRYEPKTFRQCRPDGKGGWLYNMDGVEALPYNLHQILARPDEPVFIVEGEKAAEKVATIGLLATTSHGGAKKWQPVLNRWFEGRNVIVLPDNDEAGKAHADMVVANLFGVANRIKRVELPNLPDKGDIVDWLVSNDRDALMGAVKATPVIEAAPEPVAEADDYNNDNNQGDYFEFVDEQYLINMPPVSWAVGEGDVGLITAHGLSMIYGAPGSGKSFITLDMALCQAHGIEWQGMPTKQGDVLYIAGEGVGGMGKRIKAWKMSHKLGISGHFHMLPIAVNFRDQADIEKLIRSIERLDRKWTCIYVDTLARALLGADENSSQEAGLAVAAADALKHKFECAVVFVHHSGKNSERGARGSSAILGAVDASIAITKDENLVTMSVQKQKDAEPIDDITLEMTQIASPNGSSIVLQRTDEQKKSAPKKDINMQLALESLQDYIIKMENKRPNYRAWCAYHAEKTPDHTRQEQSKARKDLQAARIIAIDDNKVWIVSENK
jgi:hypothetical protein